MVKKLTETKVTEGSNDQGTRVFKVKGFKDSKARGTEISEPR